MSKEAMKLALEQALEMLNDNREYIEADERPEYLAIYDKAIADAEKALAEQPAQQEPDAIGCKCSDCGEWQRWTPSGMTCKNGHGGAPGINHRLYTTPQPPAQPLTDEQLNDLADRCTPNTETGTLNYRVFARAIEAAHGITKGNT